MPSMCPRCGAARVEDMRFCANCSFDYSTAPSSPPNGAGGGASTSSVTPVGPPAQPRRTTPRFPRGPLIVVAVLIVAGIAIATANNGSNDRSNSGGNTRIIPDAPADTTIRVTYKLTGSARGADLTYTDSSGNIQQQSGVGVPLKTTAGTEGISFTGQSGDFVQFSAQNTGDSGDLVCEIEADGATINTGRSNGAYVIVSCSATLP
jgi:hypothetical protein